MEYPQYPAVDRGGYQYPGNHSAQANQHELSGVAGPSRGPAANNQDRNGAIQGYIVPAASNPEDPEDYTSFIPGQERWSLWSLPPIVGQLFPSPASRGFIGDVLDQNGRPATDPQTGKRLKDYPFLPRKISTKVEGWRLETWCRMDSRVNIDDFHARMVPRNRPTGNVINMRRRRFREDHTVLAWKSRRNVPSKIELQTLQRLHHDQIECNTQWSIVEIHGTGALGIQQPRTSEGEPPVAPDILPYNYFPVIMHDSRLRLQGIQRELARLREIAEREGVEDWKKLDPIHFHSSWGDRNHEQRRKTMAAKRSREDSDGSDSEWSARPQKRRRISATPPQVKREKKRREPARIRKTAHAESGPSSNHAIQSGDARTQRLGHDNVGNNPVEQRTNVENNFAVNHGQDFGQRVSQADQSQDSVPYMTGAINQTQRPSDLPNLLDNGRQGGMPLEDFTQQITDYAAELPQDQDINEEELHHGMNWGQWISTRGRSEYQQFLQFDNMSFSAWILEHAGDAYRRYFATTERGRSHARNVEAMFSNGDQPNAPAANRAGASLGDQSSTLVGHGAAASSTAQSNAAIGTSDDFSNSINSNHSSGNGAQENGFPEAPHSAPPHIERMPILAEEQPPLPRPLHTAVPTIANSNDTSELMLPTLPVLPEIPNLGGLIQRRPTSSAINPEQRPGSFSLDLSPGGLEFDIGDWMNESRLRTTSELNAQEQGSDPSNGSERIPAPTAEAETDGNVLPSVETSSIHDVVPADDTTVKPEEQNDRRPRGISDISSLGELLNVPIYPEGSDNGSSQLSNSEDVPASSPPLSQATISQRRPNAPSFGSILPQSRNLVNEATERRAGHFDGGNTVDNRMQQTTNHAQNLQHIQEPFAEQSSYADRPQVSQFSHHHAGSLYNIPFEPVNHNEVAPEIQQTQSVGGTSRVPQAQVSRPDSKKPQQQTPTGNTANGSHEPHTANGNQIMADFFAYNEVDYPLSPEPSHRLPEVETGINQNHETDRQEVISHSSRRLVQTAGSSASHIDQSFPCPADGGASQARQHGREVSQSSHSNHFDPASASHRQLSRRESASLYPQNHPPGSASIPDQYGQRAATVIHYAQDNPSRRSSVSSQKQSQTDNTTRYPSNYHAGAAPNSSLQSQGWRIQESLSQPNQSELSGQRHQGEKTPRYLQTGHSGPNSRSGESSQEFNTPHLPLNNQSRPASSSGLQHDQRGNTSFMGVKSHTRTQSHQQQPPNVGRQQVQRRHTNALPQNDQQRQNASSTATQATINRRLTQASPYDTDPRLMGPSFNGAGRR